MSLATKAFFSFLQCLLWDWHSFQLMALFNVKCSMKIIRKWVKTEFKETWEIREKCWISYNPYLEFIQPVTAGPMESLIRPHQYAFCQHAGLSKSPKIHQCFPWWWRERFWDPVTSLIALCPFSWLSEVSLAYRLPRLMRYDTWHATNKKEKWEEMYASLLKHCCRPLFCTSGTYF